MGIGVAATAVIVAVALLWFGASCRLSAGLWGEWRKLDVIDDMLRQLSARPQPRLASAAPAGVGTGDPARPLTPAADFLFASPHRQAVRFGPGQFGPGRR